MSQRFRRIQKHEASRDKGSQSDINIHLEYAHTKFLKRCGPTGLFMLGLVPKIWCQCESWSTTFTVKRWEKLNHVNGILEQAGVVFLRQNMAQRKNFKNKTESKMIAIQDPGQAWWFTQVSVVSATSEADTGGLLEPRNLSQRWENSKTLPQNEKKKHRNHLKQEEITTMVTLLEYSSLEYKQKIKSQTTILIIVTDTPLSSMNRPSSCPSEKNQ